MGKERKGCIIERMGRLYVRVAYNDSLGKRRELMRRAKKHLHVKAVKVGGRRRGWGAKWFWTAATAER